MTQRDSTEGTNGLIYSEEGEKKLYFLTWCCLPFVHVVF